MGQFDIKEWRFNYLIMEENLYEKYEDYGWRLEINPTRGGISPDALRKKLTAAGIDFEEERKNRWQILAPKDGSGSSEAKRLLDMNHFNNYKIYESVNEDYIKDLEKLDQGDIVIELDSGREWTIKKLRWWLGSPEMTLVDNTPGKSQTIEFPGEGNPNFFKYFKLKESVNESDNWKTVKNKSGDTLKPGKKYTMDRYDGEITFIRFDRDNKTMHLKSNKIGKIRTSIFNARDMELVESVNEGSSRIKDLLKSLEWALKYSKMKTTKPGYRAWAGPPTPPRKLYNDHLTDINDYTYTKLSKELGIFRDIEKALKDKKMNPRAIDKIIKKVKTSSNESVNEGTSDDLVKRIGDLEDMLWNGNNRRAEKEWEIVSGEYLPGDQYGSDQYPGPEHWDKLEDHDLRSAIDDAEHIMKKYNIREL